MGAVLAADLAAFVAAALALLLFVRIPERECALRAGGLCSGSPLAGLREGFAFLRGDRVVLTLILSISALNFFSRISYENILSPMILARSGSAEVLALVTGILGFGGIAGGLIAVRLPPPRHVSARIFGMAALALSGVGGILGGYFMYFVTRGKFNPVIGIAGVSCVPSTAKVAQKCVTRANPNAIIMHYALGVNIFGVITTAIIAAIYISLLQNS